MFQYNLELFSDVSHLHSFLVFHDCYNLTVSFFINVWILFCYCTGIFTAPVKGVYFFTFTTYSWVSSADIGVQLMKNTDEVVMVWENQDRGDNEDYASNSVVLQLKVGDRIYMSLPKGFYIAASSLHNLNTFTGYLLGQMWGSPLKIVMKG